jgi:hypothetical protein
MFRSGLATGNTEIKHMQSRQTAREKGVGFDPRQVRVGFVMEGATGIGFSPSIRFIASVLHTRHHSTTNHIT